MAIAICERDQIGFAVQINVLWTAPMHHDRIDSLLKVCPLTHQEKLWSCRIFPSPKGMLLDRHLHIGMLMVMDVPFSFNVFWQKLRSLNDLLSDVIRVLHYIQNRVFLLENTKPSSHFHDGGIKATFSMDALIIWARISLDNFKNPTRKVYNR